MRRVFNGICLAALLSCRGHAPTAAPAPEAAPNPASAPEVPVRFNPEPEAEGLSFTLFEAEADAGGADRPAVAPATPLGAAELDTLLARLPTAEIPPAPTSDFAMRERSLPPPRAGEVVSVPFPAPEGPAAPTAAAGPLTVVRRAPEGEVGLAPHLSLSFSRPMIAVSTVEEANAQVPVELSPTPPGRWQWLGTQTLVFRPDPRFPMATEYRATVPAGTKAADGTALGAPVSWSFATPPVRFLSAAPASAGISRPGDLAPQGLTPVFVFVADQKVDPGSVLEHLKLSADDRSFPLRLATPEEIAADESARTGLAAAEPGRAVAVRPVAALPKDTTFRLVAGVGTPSAEGPRLTTKEQVFQLRTYAPLRVEEVSCGWGSPCPPSSPWYVRFNNPLDTESFDPAGVKATPAVPAWSVSPEGSNLQLSGGFTGRTRYTVSVPGTLKDQFGQTLGKDTTVTLDVGPAERALVGPDRPMVLVDPTGPPKVSFFTTNIKALKVRVYAVTPSDWKTWEEWWDHWRWEDARRAPTPGTRVLDTITTVPGNPDAPVETAVDLARLLKGGSGQFIVHVEPTEQPKERWNRQEWIGWVQVTRLGLHVFQGPTELTAWVSDLATGAPLPGVEVSLPGGGAAVETGPDGLAIVPVGREVEVSGLVARRYGDTAWLPEDAEYPNVNSGWQRYERLDQGRWFVFSDKQLYKPSETVHVRGWLRRIALSGDGDLHHFTKWPETVRWTLRSSMGNPLGEGTAPVSPRGGFELSVALPKTPDLGSAWFELVADGGDPSGSRTALSVSIEEFRTPEFEVVTAHDAAPVRLGEDTRVELDAHYYAGGALPAAPVTWRVQAEPASFAPAGWDEWSFGVWAPWWRFDRPMGGGVVERSLSATTDGGGVHRLGIHLDGMRPVRPYSVTAEASVQDVNRQTWSSSQTFLVHPSSLYVGLRARRSVVDKGQPVDVDWMVADLDGVAQAGVGAELAFARLEWRRTGKGWEEVPVAGGACTGQSVVPSNTTPPATCRFVPDAGGAWRVTATVKDAKGRPNTSELRIWVSGEATAPDRGIALDEAELVPDRKSYAPGDVARIFVSVPFWPADGVLTARREGLLRTVPFHVSESSTTVELPIEAGWLPEVAVSVEVVGSAPRTDDRGERRSDLPRRPAFASGSLTLPVSTLHRSLGVKVEPAAARVAPGQDTTVKVRVSDPKGQPVTGAEIALFAVDEAVLALVGYQTPDPVSVFYAARGSEVSDLRAREWLRTVGVALAGLGASGTGEGGGGRAPGAAGMDASAMANMSGAAPPAPSTAPTMAARAAPMEMKKEKAPDAEAAGNAATGSPVAMRTNFAALALWSPSLVTDAQGVAEVGFKLPDNLTRYRVMAVAVHGEQLFGSGATDLTAALPLMVRPSLPRFLNFGDRFELPVVLQNQTDAPLDVLLAIRTSNLSVDGAAKAGRRVSVPPNDRVEVRFPAQAQLAGTARYEVVAATGTRADAASGTLPVWTPATTEAFATYGSVEGAALAQPIRAPKGVVPSFGGLEVTTSSTQLQALTDAFLYIVRYRFDCNEQISSRLLAIAALRDVLGAFQVADMPSEAELQAVVAADLEVLKRRQNWDGGFAFWRKGDASWPWLSIHAANALVQVKAKGYAVDPAMLSRSMDYLRNIDRHIPAWYSQEAKWTLRAYALDVRERAGEPDVAAAKRLVAQATVERLPLDAQGWVLPTLAAAKAPEAQLILRWIQNHVTESAGSAHFVTGYSDGAYVLLHSDRRADGVVLDALLRVNAEDPLLPKVVSGLLAHRVQGRWANTSESSFVLLALDRYFHTVEKTTPDFVARAWLGDGASPSSWTYAGEHRFQGRTTERANMPVPMATLLSGASDKQLLLQADGKGRMYYRIGLSYAPESLRLAALDQGFAVSRRYEAVDDPADVRRDAEGVWHVRAGARVRVRLAMSTPMRRYHVALVDPLPAGLEVLNPELRGTGALPPDPSSNKEPYWWWYRSWFEHENLRDDRVEAFSTLVWDGVWDYTYVARATTLGSFVVPPTKAEEMYAPETFGRSASDRVIIE